MPEKRTVAAVTGKGSITLIEQDVPPLTDGTVLVEVHSSLVSPGTELGGWRRLRAELDEPKPLAEPRPFGYANAGVVLETGEGVRGLRPGDRVACMGSGYALHADYAVVPQNLCAPLPDEVSFAQGAYGHLAATALHALRRGEPGFGEFTGVVGLGIVGQLAARLHQLAGRFVIGWDVIPLRCRVARGWGIDTAVLAGSEDEVAATEAFTAGAGLDSAVLAFGGDATAAVESIERCLKRSPDGHPVGRIVVVGGCKFPYTSSLTNVDIRRASRTGPGYHDEPWERGADYPPVFVRWSTRANLQLCIRLIAAGRLDVNCLTTHTIPLARAEAGIAAIINEPDEILGVVFEMEHQTSQRRERRDRRG